MARRPQKKKKEEEGVAPWLATYGDMITLVLTLFVLLYSFSSIDAVKWDRLVSSLSGTPFVAIQALDPSRIGPESRADDKELGDNDEMNMDENEEKELHEVEARPTEGNSMDADIVKEQFDELYMKISEHIKENNLETKLNVEKLDDFIILHITDSTLFDSGEADIKHESKEMLHKVAELFAEYEKIIKIIRIEGHTDNRPIHNDVFKSNWELSTTRAVNVLRYFLGITDVENDKFCASGYGEYHPIDTNETPEGRAVNRRVDFLIESIYTNN